MPYLKIIKTAFKNNLILFVILCAAFLMYYLTIQIIYVRPFVNICNATEKGISSTFYVKEMNQVIKISKWPI